MEINSLKHLLRLVSVPALAAIVSACSGTSATPSSAQYAPASATAINEAGLAPGAKAKITSSCPKLIIIGGGRSMACTFQEAGYKGKFTVYENPNYSYVFTVSPTSGNKKTSFIVQGLGSGGGKFSVSDKNGNQIIRDVRVSS